eukprot:6214402-Pleurochrysis_carterae.AAC.1
MHSASAKVGSKAGLVTPTRNGQFIEVLLAFQQANPATQRAGPDERAERARLCKLQCSLLSALSFAPVMLLGKRYSLRRI